MKYIIFVIAIISVIHYVYSTNKYSEELNSAKQYRRLERPFRMQKINLLWEKAQKKLPEQKLKALYMDLSLQDKDEIAWKKMKSTSQDNDGLKEAALRKSLNTIVTKYGLVDHLTIDDENTLKNQVSAETPEESLNKRIFKDKKLNKLWTKVEKAEFSDEELKTLKEEFQHHQEKLDQYHQLVDAVNKDPKRSLPDEMDNSIDALMKEESAKENMPSAQQVLKEKYNDLKTNYDHLAGKVLQGKPMNFEELRVEKLWRMAQKADFTPSELESLKEELHHYEHRVKKLKFLEGEIELSNERYNANKYVDEDKSDIQKNREQRVKDYSYKVNKIHTDIETRILQRHLEL